MPPGVDQPGQPWPLSFSYSLSPVLAGENSVRSKILVVEDNEILLMALQILLEEDGFKVLPASNGREALEFMQHTRPDLILSDISMPVMDGFAFFRTVRSQTDWITIPFIFMSGNSDQEDILSGKKLGADDYLVKPLNHKELLASIHSRLARSQELLIAQLNQAYHASMIMLSNAIELRDHYTRGHVERVMGYSLAIAVELGWNSSQINFLQFGSILHDIGKIYIREKLLTKPASLTNPEWVEMKRHPELGAELVKMIPYLEPAIPIILHHHERWDGQGYPWGLSGSEIPLGARIVAVADSLDAMTSNRVYQCPRSMDEAYQEILSCSGCQYDPQVVEAFQAAWNSIESQVAAATIP